MQTFAIETQLLNCSSKARTKQSLASALSFGDRLHSLISGAVVPIIPHAVSDLFFFLCNLPLGGQLLYVGFLERLLSPCFLIGQHLCSKAGYHADRLHSGAYPRFLSRASSRQLTSIS